MADNYAKIEKNREKLVAIYHSLPELDRAIVQLISVIYRPVGRTQVLACMEYTQLCGNKPWIAITLKPYLDRLLANELLIMNGKHNLQIHPLIAEIATRDAVRLGRFGVMSKDRKSVV